MKTTRPNPEVTFRLMQGSQESLWGSNNKDSSVWIFVNFPFSPNPWSWIKSTRPRPFPPDTLPTIFKKSERISTNLNLHPDCSSEWQPFQIFWFIKLSSVCSSAQIISQHHQAEPNMAQIISTTFFWKYTKFGEILTTGGAITCTWQHGWLSTANQNSAVDIRHVNNWHSFRLRTETNEGATISSCIFWVIPSNQNFVGCGKTACSYDKLNKSYKTTTGISHTQEKKQS